MPEEIMNEVVENTEDVKEISLLKVLAIGAGIVALGFAAVKGGKFLKHTIQTKTEPIIEEIPADAAVETATTETPEEGENK